MGPSRSSVSRPLFHVIWDQSGVFRASTALLGANCSHSSQAHLPKLTGEGVCVWLFSRKVSNLKTNRMLGFASIPREGNGLASMSEPQTAGERPRPTSGPATEW